MTQRDLDLKTIKGLEKQIKGMKEAWDYWMTVKNWYQEKKRSNDSGWLGFMTRIRNEARDNFIELINN